MTDNTMTNNTRTLEAHEAYVANRREAGRVIDIETCEVSRFETWYSNPYGTYPFDDHPTPELEHEVLIQCYWVRSEESDGWIFGGDLPPEKQQALPRQYKRTLNLYKLTLSLWYAARALHPLYEVVIYRSYCEDEIEWKGDGAEPSQDELIQWFKVNHPTLASEIERRIRAEIEANGSTP